MTGGVEEELGTANAIEIRPNGSEVGAGRHSESERRGLNGRKIFSPMHEFEHSRLGDTNVRDQR